jgi:pyridoxine/pyridoxamine 5'-phosphate oxidase
MAQPIGERPHMPDYGVDSADWQPLPWSWAAERLAAGRNFWIVTVSATGRPHAMPVWGVWDDTDRRFAFSCGPRSRKAANIAANPQVVVASEDTVEALSIEGRAQRVDGERMEAWIDRYLAKYRPISPDLSAEFLRQNLVFEVIPERALAIIESEEEFSTRATRWRYESGS